MKVLKIIELGGDYVAREIIERSKNKDIIYLTEDIILNTKCVQQLSEYIENLIARNKGLESALDNSVSKDEIKEILKNKGGSSFIAKSDLQELLNKGE